MVAPRNSVQNLTIGGVRIVMGGWELRWGGVG